MNNRNVVDKPGENGGTATTLQGTHRFPRENGSDTAASRPGRFELITPVQSSQTTYKGRVDTPVPVAKPRKFNVAAMEWTTTKAKLFGKEDGHLRMQSDPNAFAPPE